MKYKVGDRVRIVSKWTDGMDSCSEMNCWLGKDMTITGIDYTHGVYSMEEDNGEWGWYDDMIAGLAEPELSAEEVLQICNEICEENNGCQNCPMLENCYSSIFSDKKKVVEICKQWKADHEKKEPEVEWYWQGYIQEVNSMDILQCYDTGCESEESAEEYMADELKEYCKQYEGSYTAGVKRACRVKAVE